VAALMHAEEAFAPLHQHVTIITLTLDFNKDVGGGWCGQQRWRRQIQGSDSDMRRADLLHFVLLRTDFLSGIMLSLRFPALSCRLLRKFVEPIIENVLLIE
jgi:hypothetical protein